MFIFLLTLLLSFTTLEARVIDSVNIFIGTGDGNVVDGVPGGKGGGTQPGAGIPFGMVSFGPDTDAPENSGYDHKNNFIRGFSLTHLSGPGCRNTGDLPMLPVNNSEAWPNPIGFLKKDQYAHPGYYTVTLANGIRVELTATERTGLAYFTPAKGAAMSVLFNTFRNGPGDTTGTFRQLGPNTFEGKVTGGDFCGKRNLYNVFFTIETSSPVESYSYLNGIAALKFKNDGKKIQIKTGISYVSQEGSAKNLRAENDGWDFYRILERAQNAWEKALSTIEINGGTSDSRTLFYTSLYRSLLHPNISSDVTGEYLGFDHKIHRDNTRTHYQNFSGWDIYRTQVQLLALLFPRISSDIAQSFVDAGSQCGAIPEWSQNNFETSIMVGDPGAIVLANFKAFGATDFDQEKALSLMFNSAFNRYAKCQGIPARPGLAEYIERGYIPEPTKGVWGPAATTLEYASADFAVSVFGRNLGRIREANELLERSGNWKNLFDSETSLIRPRTQDGNFITPFDPAGKTGFVEGNAYQYTWMIPFDGKGLMEKLGGQMRAASTLDSHVAQLNGGLSTPYLYIGNEPGFNTPWMFLWAKAPWKTQSLTRRLLVEEFRNSVGGLPGNDDLGALGSFYVWTSMGLFPSIPGVGGFTIGSPSFSEVIVRSAGNEKFIHIIAEETEKNIYVENLVINGTSWRAPWVAWDDLGTNTQIVFQMTNSPSIWGSDSTPP